LVNRQVILFLSIASLLSVVLFIYAFADAKPVCSGAKFPKLTFKNILSREEQAYLGISKKTNFSFNDIRGNLIVVEVFSTYCTSCPRNIPLLNKAYSTVKNNPGLKGKVKVISIAVGNNQNEVKSYKKEYKVLYPILTDLNFTAHKALGNPRVPFTVFVKKDSKGNCTVASTHQGLFESENFVMNKINEVFP
jgi:thiol-disulfide isomerase/thioredoxin